MIDKANIPNHYFVRISHDSTEAILSTIEEQRIDLLITDYETLRSNKALQTLATCNMLAILTGGGDEELAFEDSVAKGDEELQDEENGRMKKNLVVLYDGGDHSDMVLKTASWLEHSGRFKITVISIKKKKNGSILAIAELIMRMQGSRRKKKKKSMWNI